jgi:hypothetical protein
MGIAPAALGHTHPACDADCRPGACTFLCQARHAYAAALAAVRRSETSPDLTQRIHAHERLETARALVHGMYGIAHRAQGRDLA